MQNSSRIHSQTSVHLANFPVAFKSSKQSMLAFALRKRWLPLAVLLSMVLVATLVVGQSAPPSIPVINLSTDPLFSAAGGDKPVMALALSVEYPTVGAQYLPPVSNATTDATYSNLNEYLGYYDAESCYSYNNTPTEIPATGLSASDYKRFDRSGSAGTGTTLHMCTNAFSGNFLNWASNSAIDMLRLALSGGDRYIDTASLTILQRAVIPNGDPVCMWNSSNFPGKQLQKDGGGSGKYWGAVPTALVTQAAGSDIWVGNTLNRIYFGTGKTGGCGDTGAYILGTSTNSSNVGPITDSSTALPGDAVSCASENATCSFSGVKEVWYGASITTGNGKKTVTTNYWKVAPASNGLSCSNNIFGDPISGTAKNCYTRASNWVPPTSASTLNSDGFFYSRVQVCNASGSPLVLQDVRDYGLCKQYPSGYFKPTGSIQKYSDQLRLAAFGYLMDQTASYSGGRYGGVLRAPMKFVGSKTFDTAGQDNTPTGGNPKTEWNASTGVFNTNPDNDATQTTPISGVINYLNKFGRTGPTPGRYKIYDPVGELYYETLRYLQGLQPTPAAVSGLTSPTDAIYDGFPVTKTWTDPYGDGRSATTDYACLKSNIVVIGDVNTHDGNNLPAVSIANNIPDISAWTSVVQKFEKNTSSTYFDGQGISRTTGNPNNPTNGNPPGNQIVGTAYWAHTHDIRGTDWIASPSLQRPGLRTKTFFFDVNEYANSNSTAYRQNNNQFFTAAKYGGFESDAGNLGGKPYNTFGNPFKSQNSTNDNDVWQDSTRPGEASTYYLQSSARGVLNAFDSIFSRASTSARSIAGAATSGRSLTPTGSNSTYQAAFDTSDWSGDVLSVPLNLTGTSTVTVGSATWSAAERLGLLPTPAISRNIVIGMPGATANPVATAFTWAAIGAAMQTNLAKLTPASATDSLGEARVNYLRGDRSNEGASFRRRNKLLGDILNSGIVASGKPTASVSSTSAYATFSSENASRTPTLFVGANDGMLHAFNSTNGDEIFGYIPSWMGTKLAALTSKTYLSNHQAYVDGTPAVAEAQVGSSGTASDWKTVLVSGTGAGGSGVFALDVTDPGRFSASNVMWEFTRADDVDLGYVVGRPQILKLRTSAPSQATATYRWFAVVASGVNNYLPDSLFNGAFSPSGNPALFLLALDKPVGAAWSYGTNYYKISLPADSILNANNGTGLINFQPIFGGNVGELTQVYMGDLHGKLWKLDFAARGASEWTMDKLSPYKKGSSAPFIPYPLYIAKTADNTTGLIQPISMAPAVVPGPNLNGISTNYITFATGKYLEASDKTSSISNSIYEVFDNGSTAADSSPAGASIISGRGRLTPGTINTSTGVVSTPAFKWGRAASDTDASQRSGIYVDLSITGERGITNPKVAGDYLLLNSLIPASAGATGSCTAAGGDGRQYRINYLTGKGTVENSTTGLLGEPLLINLPSASTYTISSTTGQRTKTVVQQVIQPGSLGVATGSLVTNTVVTGRLSWRQINNYQNLKNVP
ncbi:pilus assembly protein [Polaromonas sp. CG_9.11]|uniref:pilus assembly protein n=1 Tax=Polaromonas sp. CG_9.11 TaxID=2787730 RepID=UPI001A340156|nr:PilC/PilY family type IV pilus protein [Polaromonas sp. CG_9.11]MBG6075499.1 type IV pilus assembly protein PilY1 [Polaromonas sp. CG_9.11]